MKQAYLWEKLGEEIQVGLDDNSVTEIILNPDGKLWFVTKDQGTVCQGTLLKTRAMAFVHALAQYQHKFLNEKMPYLDATLPFNGERINVTMPPITDHVSFNIRKHAQRVYSLEDYVRAEIISEQQATILEQAIRDRKNILVSGSPASGKTTLKNALL